MSNVRKDHGGLCCMQTVSTIRIHKLLWLVTSGPQQPLCSSQWHRNTTIFWECLTSELGNMAKNQNQTGHFSQGRVILAICPSEGITKRHPKEWAKATRKEESRKKERLQNLDGGRNDSRESSKWNRSQIKLILLPAPLATNKATNLKASHLLS